MSESGRGEGHRLQGQLRVKLSCKAPELGAGRGDKMPRIELRAALCRYLPIHRHGEERAGDAEKGLRQRAHMTRTARPERQ